MKDRVDRRVLSKIFNLIGDLPETHLNRQPFYDTVWRKEFNGRVANAQEQGVELTKEVMRGSTALQGSGFAGSEGNAVHHRAILDDG